MSVRLQINNVEPQYLSVLFVSKDDQYSPALSPAAENVIQLSNDGSLIRTLVNKPIEFVGMIA